MTDLSRELDAYATEIEQYARAARRENTGYVDASERQRFEHGRFIEGIGLVYGPGLAAALTEQFRPLEVALDDTEWRAEYTERVLTLWEDFAYWLKAREDKAWGLCDDERADKAATTEAKVRVLQAVADNPKATKAELSEAIDKAIAIEIKSVRATGFSGAFEKATAIGAL